MKRALLLAISFGLCSVAAAQGHPPGGMGGGIGRGMPMGENRFPVQPNITENRGGFRLGLPGRWWDDKDVARHVGLVPAQQKRMDDVFGANRENLNTLYKSLQHEESQLARLTRSRELDENQIFQQIDRVTQARGELDKAYAHMLLMIRKEMTPEQATKLDELASTTEQ